MISSARGISLVLALGIAAGLILVPGCLGGEERTKDSPAPTGIQIPPATSPEPTIPPIPTPPVDPIVGRWYAPVPDDLTFEFLADGTFIEESPNFPAYHGTWSSSEENFYDAYILDQWGYRKPAKLLYATGSLMTKGIGTMHRVG
jgi:hypothetical protein